MNYLDIIIAIPLLLGLWEGFRQGLIVQIIGLAALVAGVYLAFVFGSKAGMALGLEGLTATAVGFFAVFAIVVALLFILGRLTRGLFKIAGLGVFDTLLGMLFSTLKAALIVGVLLMWLSDLDTGNNIIKESAAKKSRLYGPVLKTSQTVFPYLMSVKERFLDTENPES